MTWESIPALPVFLNWSFKCLPLWPHGPLFPQASRGQHSAPLLSGQALPPKSIPARPFSSYRPLSPRILPCTALLKYASPIIMHHTRLISLSQHFSICKYMFLWTIICLIICPIRLNLPKGGHGSNFILHYIPKPLAGPNINAQTCFEE